MISTCIIGGLGNMGRRYAAILASEGMPYTIIDKGDSLPRIHDGATHFIIATPTDTHGRILRMVAEKYKEPVNILVEKPVVKLGGTLRGLRPVERALDAGHNVYMVNQYAYYSHGITEGKGPTWYDYYNSGPDGLAWDCIQLIHLAKGGIGFLAQNSPVWNCGINGRSLNRELIDLCYVKMIKDFLSNGAAYGRLWGWDDIKDSHAKALEYEADLIRHPGQKHIHTPAR
jgi:hypothetical protein